MKRSSPTAWLRCATVVLLTTGLAPLSAAQGVFQDDWDAVATVFVPGAGYQAALRADPYMGWANSWDAHDGDGEFCEPSVIPPFQNAALPGEVAPWPPYYRRTGFVSELIIAWTTPIVLDDPTDCALDSSSQGDYFFAIGGLSTHVERDLRLSYAFDGFARPIREGDAARSRVRIGLVREGNVESCTGLIGFLVGCRVVGAGIDPANTADVTDRFVFGFENALPCRWPCVDPLFDLPAANGLYQVCFNIAMEFVGTSQYTRDQSWIYLDDESAQYLAQASLPRNWDWGRPDTDCVV